MRFEGVNIGALILTGTTPALDIYQNIHSTQYRKALPVGSSLAWGSAFQSRDLGCGSGSECVHHPGTTLYNQCFKVGAGFMSRMLSISSFVCVCVCVVLFACLLVSVGSRFFKGQGCGILE